MKITITPDRVELSTAELIRIIVEAVERETGRKVYERTIKFGGRPGEAAQVTVELLPVPPESPLMPQWKIQYRSICSGQWCDDNANRFATEKSALDCLKSLGVVEPLTNVRVVPA